MTPSAPHYLLVSAASDSPPGSRSAGRWRFALESVAGGGRFEAGDEERDTHGERLELLAVVRGLEALDQPSRVTLRNASRYVVRGLRYGLPNWRESGWQWECYGEFVPVKNCDLWQRLERAMQIHDVECEGLDEVETAARSHGSRRSEPETPIPVIQRGQRRYRVDRPHGESSSESPMRRPTRRRGARPAVSAG